MSQDYSLWKIFRLVGQAILPAAAFQAALWGRMESCGRLIIGLPVLCTSLQQGRLTIGLQDSILPHKPQNRVLP